MDDFYFGFALKHDGRAKKKMIVRTRLSIYLKVAALGVTTNLRSDLERMKLGGGDDLTTF